MSLEIGTLQLFYRDRSQPAHSSFSFAGVRPTIGSHSAVVNLHVTGVLYSGECTITLATVERSGISGSFSCVAINPYPLASGAIVKQHRREW